MDYYRSSHLLRFLYWGLFEGDRGPGTKFFTDLYVLNVADVNTFTT